MALEYCICTKLKFYFASSCLCQYCCKCVLQKTTTAFCSKNLIRFFFLPSKGRKEDLKIPSKRMVEYLAFRSIKYWWGRCIHFCTRVASHCLSSLPQGIGKKSASPRARSAWIFNDYRLHCFSATKPPICAIEAVRTSSQPASHGLLGLRLRHHLRALRCPVPRHRRIHLQPAETEEPDGRRKREDDLLDGWANAGGRVKGFAQEQEKGLRVWKMGLLSSSLFFQSGDSQEDLLLALSPWFSRCVRYCLAAIFSRFMNFLWKTQD